MPRSMCANAAPAVVNLDALPLYFASGIFMPVGQLPTVIGRLSPYLPTYRSYYNTYRTTWQRYYTPASIGYLTNRPVVVRHL